MKRNDIKILIVEDDKSFAEALKQLMLRTGYNVTVAHNATDALAAQKQQLFAITVVDCLLPKISGIDLALKMKTESTLAGPLFLISGIFKDKNFIKDAISKTGAAQFIPKPIPPDEFLKIIEIEIAPLLDDTLPPLLDLLTKENLTPGEKIEAVKTSQSVHGFELPRIMSYLMTSGTHSNGICSLVDPEGRLAKLFLSGGKIVRIESQDRQSFFGFLLVERGLISHDKLENALRQPNTQNKRLGERLVDANLLSPHWIPLINTDQMGIRLSMLVQETFYEVKFEQSEITETEGHFDRPNLALFLNDFVNSKLSLEWLKNFYSAFMECPPQWTKSTDKTSPVFTFGPLARNPQVLQSIEQGKNLSEIVLENRDKEHEILSGVHLLVMHQMIYFPIKLKTLDPTMQLTRLRQMQVEYLNRDDFEILGVPRRAKSVDIKKAYYELSKTYHPDRLPPDVDKELMELTKAVFTKITSAYNRLADDERRNSYLKELVVGQAAKIMKAEAIIEEGKTLLKSGNAIKALERFTQALALRPLGSELNMYIVWAKLLTVGPHNPKTQEVLAEADAELNKIIPEDRHNALYYFVKGLLFKNRGDLLMAMDNILHAVSLKPEFIEAKRELHLLQISQRKPGGSNIMKADLKDVVGMFFKRK